tara:strand:+ start:3210 stop:3527 length:318 start_codon:yes stop_codon:yes gene_type:complete
MSNEYEIECGDLIDIKFERATGISGVVMATQPLTITSIYCNELFNTVIIGSFQTIAIIKKKKNKLERLQKDVEDADGLELKDSTYEPWEYATPVDLNLRYKEGDD